MSVKERVAHAKKGLASMEKSIAALDPDKLLPKMGHCTSKEREIFRDALQIRRAQREKYVETLHLFMVERDMTPEEIDQMAKLCNEANDMGDSEEKSWDRVMEICMKA